MNGWDIRDQLPWFLFLYTYRDWTSFPPCRFLSLEFWVRETSEIVFISLTPMEGDIGYNSRAGLVIHRINMEQAVLE